MTSIRPSVFLEWSKPVKPTSLGVFFSAPVSFDLSAYLPSPWSESLNKFAGFHCEYTCPNPERLFLSLSWHFQFFPFLISLFLICPSRSCHYLLRAQATLCPCPQQCLSISAISNCSSGLAPSRPQDPASVYSASPELFAALCRCSEHPSFLFLATFPFSSLLLIASLGSLTTVATDIFFCEVCTEFLVKEFPPCSCLSGVLCQSLLCAPSSLLDHKGLGYGWLVNFPIDLLSCREPHPDQWGYLEMLSGKFLKQMWHPLRKDILLGAWGM